MTCEQLIKVLSKANPEAPVLVSMINIYPDETGECVYHMLEDIKEVEDLGDRVQITLKDN